MRLAANFRSSGWNKDLEHILCIYYKFNVASFNEGEWSRVRDLFFSHFLQYKEEALALKEARPMDFMAYIQNLFYQATSLHLDGLGSFTGWIKRGSYYHGLVARQGHLHECLHLTGAALPRWPQVAPSKSHRLQVKQDTQVPSSSRPSAGAMVAPITETPMAEAPVGETQGAEAPVACSSTPAPMETGGAGDGQSWAEQMEAGEQEAFQRSRSAKRPHSQSRRRDPKPQLPFPLQDSEGRLVSISQLIAHVAEQDVTHHNVAGWAIMHLHPELLLQKAKCLGNQVACMIAKFHLTASVRGPLSLSPLIPHEVAALLPALKSYLPGVTFKGTRDMRVTDRAKSLHVAVWLHRLDMAAGGEALASETLEALQHCLGPLLESFLTPRMSNLTFQEVVDHVLKENRRACKQSLQHLWGSHIHGHEMLERLIKSHGELDKSDKASRRNLKKEIDQKRKSLKMLRERISYHETQLGQEPSEGDAPDGDGQVGQGAQAKMAPASGAYDAPSESTMAPATPASDPPPPEAKDQVMEVDDYGTHPSLPSPISHEDDDLLSGPPQSEVTEVESGLAHLSVSSPRGPNGEGEEASH